MARNRNSFEDLMKDAEKIEKRDEYRKANSYQPFLTHFFTSTTIGYFVIFILVVIMFFLLTYSK